MPASFGEVRARLLDEHGRASDALGSPAYLAKAERAPLLLGFAGFLSRFPVHIDRARRQAWLEVP